METDEATVHKLLAKFINNPNKEVLQKFIAYTKEFNKRMFSILNYSKEKQCTTLLDAEQSYIQQYIFSSSLYFIKQINNNNAIALITVQSYLRESKELVYKYEKFCRKNNLPLTIKLVRGAYINEEKIYSMEKGIECPVRDDIESTHEAYNHLAEFIQSNYQKGDKVRI